MYIGWPPATICNPKVILWRQVSPSWTSKTCSGKGCRWNGHTRPPTIKGLKSWLFPFLLKGFIQAGVTSVLGKYQIFGGIIEPWSVWIITHLIFYCKDIAGNFIIKLATSLKFVYCPQTWFFFFLAREGGTESMAPSLNHSLSVLSITLVSFPCFWPALFLDQTLAGWEVIRTRWT